VNGAIAKCMAMLYEVSLDMTSTLEIDEVFRRIAAA
jgi:hypothetical protein